MNDDNNQFSLMRIASISKFLSVMIRVLIKKQKKINVKTVVTNSMR